MKQLSFLPKINLSHSTAHGGDLRQGKRKTARPFDPRRPIHLVLRSERARGKWSMLRHKERIERLLESAARKYAIRIHRFANVGNHLHVLVSMAPAPEFQGPSTARSRAKPKPTSTAIPRIGLTRYEQARTRFSSFLRQFAGAVAFEITGASKSNPVGRFWDGLVFTRVLHWGREFQKVMLYLVKNLFEAAALWNRKKHPDWEIGWGAEAAPS